MYIEAEDISINGRKENPGVPVIPSVSEIVGEEEVNLHETKEPEIDWSKIPDIAPEDIPMTNENESPFGK